LTYELFLFGVGVFLFWFLWVLLPPKGKKGVATHG